MGVIVGSTQSWLECDEPGCSNKTQPCESQEQARKNAERLGWLKSGTTGRVTCPACRANS